MTGLIYDDKIHPNQIILKMMSRRIIVCLIFREPDQVKTGIELTMKAACEFR